MGKKDVSSTEYLKDPARYADIINTYYFSGDQIVLPEHVHPQKPNDNIVFENNNTNIITVNRDIVKDVDIMMNTTIIALENQSDIHYAMPIRVMAGDAAAYHSQWRTLAKKHYDKKDLKSEEYIADYPIHILEVRRFDDFENFQTDLRSVFGFLRYSQDADKLSAYLSEHKEDFTELASDAAYLISQFSRSYRLLENLHKNTYQTDKGGINMCKALDDLMERNLNNGINIGIERGIERGIETSIHMLRDINTPKEHVAKLISDNFALTPERAYFYIEKNWG